MNGGATDAQIGSFTTALRMKGETISELTGFAKSHASKAATIENGTDAIDIVGTGGDMANTFNISTTTSFVVAGAGSKSSKTRKSQCFQQKRKRRRTGTTWCKHFTYLRNRQLLVWTNVESVFCLHKNFTAL